jgi:uncharacterized membrane protein SpoIIM required for sporulation
VSIPDTKEDNNKWQNTSIVKSNLRISSLLIVLALLIVSLSSGTFSGWWFAKKYSKQIVVIDVEKIVEKRKDEFTTKYSATDTNNTATKQEMMTDITRFAQKLANILGEEGKDRIILSNGAVVSDATDITKIVEERVWGQ